MTDKLKSDAFWAFVGTVVLAAITATAYAIAYVMEATFYGAFGVPSSYMDLDGPGALLRLTPAVMIVLFVGVALAVMVLAAATYLRRGLRRHTRLDIGVGPCTLAVLFLLVAAPVIMRLGGAPPPSSWEKLSLITLPLMGVAAALWAVTRHLWGSAIGNIALALAIVAMSTAQLAEAAASGGARLRETCQPNLTSLMLGVNGIPVELTWKPDSPKPHTTEGRLIMVGRTGDGIVLYSCSTQQTFVANSDDITVAIKLYG